MHGVEAVVPSGGAARSGACVKGRLRAAPGWPDRPVSVLASLASTHIPTAAPRRLLRAGGTHGVREDHSDGGRFGPAHRLRSERRNRHCRNDIRTGTRAIDHLRPWRWVRGRPQVPPGPHLGTQRRRQLQRVDCARNYRPGDDDLGQCSACNDYDCYGFRERGRIRSCPSSRPARHDNDRVAYGRRQNDGHPCFARNHDPGIHLGAG